MGDQLPEFAELVVCMFLHDKGKVAKALQSHVGMLEDVFGALQAENNEPITVSALDDLDELEDYIGVLTGEFDKNPQSLIEAFKGHEQFLADVITLINDGNFEAGQDDGMSKFAEADEDDVVALLAKIKSPVTSVLTKNQALTLLRSNLWIKPENPNKILQEEGLKTLLKTIKDFSDDDDMVVKACQTLEALFDYKGSIKIACSGSKQLIMGRYIMALGKPWDPANFVCGNTGESIVDEFYVIDHKPYTPNSLSSEQKKDRTLHKVHWVDQDAEGTSRAALPFMQQFAADGGFDQFLKSISNNMSVTKDEYGVSAAAKVIKKMAEVDPEYIDVPLELLRETKDEGIITTCLICLMIPAVWKDALLAKHLSFLVETINKAKASYSNNEILCRKATAVLKRIV